MMMMIALPSPSFAPAEGLRCDNSYYETGDPVASAGSSGGAYVRAIGSIFEKENLVGWVYYLTDGQIVVQANADMSATNQHLNGTVVPQGEDVSPIQDLRSAGTLRIVQCTKVRYHRVLYRSAVSPR